MIHTSIKHGSACFNDVANDCNDLLPLSQGVRVSVLCRDICWLLEEVLFRNTDVGYGGSLVGLVHHALSLLHPYLLLAAAPPTGEPIIAPRPDPDSLLILSQHCDLLTHVFIHEAVGGGQSVLKIGWRQGNLLLAGVMHLSFFEGASVGVLAHLVYIGKIRHDD